VNDPLNGVPGEARTRPGSFTPCFLFINSRTRPTRAAENAARWQVRYVPQVDARREIGAQRFAQASTLAGDAREPRWGLRSRVKGRVQAAQCSGPLFGVSRIVLTPSAAMVHQG